MTEKQIFSKFSNSKPSPEKPLYLPIKNGKIIFFIAIQSVYKDDHSYQFLFILDIPVSNYDGKHFLKMLLRPSGDRVKQRSKLHQKAQLIHVNAQISLDY